MGGGETEGVPGAGWTPGPWVPVVVLAVEESTCNVGGLGSIPGLGRSLGKGKATHSSILAWRIPRLYSPWGCKESDATEQLSLH